MSTSAGRRVGRGLLVLLAIVVVLWSAAWFVVRIVADGRIDDALDRQAARGRKIMCAERSFEGFPFAFRVTCARFSLGAVTPLRPLTIAGGRASFGISLADPFTFRAALSAPVEVGLDNGETFTLRWREANLRVGYDTNTIREARFEAASPEIAAAGRPIDGARAQALTLSVERSAVRPPSDVAFDIALRISGIVAPPLDRATRNDAPADLSVDLVLTSLGGLVGLPPPLALDRWRRAGGQLDITGLVFAKGDIRLDAAGNLAIDDERRLRGRITGGGRGVAFGQNAPGTRLGDILARVGAAAANVRVPFTIVMENGQAKMGPLKLADLPPLY